jgi:hypothetical protein
MYTKAFQDHTQGQEKIKILYTLDTSVFLNQTSVPYKFLYQVYYTIFIPNYKTFRNFERFQLALETFEHLLNTI